MGENLVLTTQYGNSIPNITEYAYTEFSPFMPFKTRE